MAAFEDMFRRMLVKRKKEKEEGKRGTSRRRKAKTLRNKNKNADVPDDKEGGPAPSLDRNAFVCLEEHEGQTVLKHHQHLRKRRHKRKKACSLSPSASTLGPWYTGLSPSTLGTSDLSLRCQERNSDSALAKDSHSRSELAGHTEKSPGPSVTRSSRRKPKSAAPSLGRRPGKRLLGKVPSANASLDSPWGRKFKEARARCHQRFSRKNFATAVGRLPLSRPFPLIAREVSPGSRHASRTRDQSDRRRMVSRTRDQSRRRPVNSRTRDQSARRPVNSRTRDQSARRPVDSRTRNQSARRPVVVPSGSSSSAQDLSGCRSAWSVVSRVECEATVQCGLPDQCPQCAHTSAQPPHAPPRANRSFPRSLTAVSRSSSSTSVQSLEDDSLPSDVTLDPSPGRGPWSPAVVAASMPDLRQAALSPGRHSGDSSSGKFPVSLRGGPAWAASSAQQSVGAHASVGAHSSHASDEWQPQSTCHDPGRLPRGKGRKVKDACHDQRKTRPSPLRQGDPLTSPQNKFPPIYARYAAFPSNGARVLRKAYPFPVSHLEESAFHCDDFTPNVKSPRGVALQASALYQDGHLAVTVMGDRNGNPACGKMKVHMSVIHRTAPRPSTPGGSPGLVRQRDMQQLASIYNPGQQSRHKRPRLGWRRADRDVVHKRALQPAFDTRLQQPSPPKLRPRTLAQRQDSPETSRDAAPRR